MYLQLCDILQAQTRTTTAERKARKPVNGSYCENMASIEKTWIWKSFRHRVCFYELSRKSALNDALLFPDILEFARNEGKVPVACWCESGTDLLRQLYVLLYLEVANQTFYLTLSQYTDTMPTSPSADPITQAA